MLIVPHAGAMIFLEYAFLTCSKVWTTEGLGVGTERPQSLLV